MRGRLAIFGVVLTVGAGAAAAIDAAAATPYDTPWKPDYPAGRDYAKQREAKILAFEVRTQSGPADTVSHSWAWHETKTAPSVSIVKAMILAAFLRRDDVRNRDLTSHEKNDNLKPMITRSDDNATNRTFSHVGFDRLRKLAAVVGMKHFRQGDVNGSPDSRWGRVRINAEDQSLYFLHIDQFIPERHRAYAMKLLRSVIPEQRWGAMKLADQGGTPGWTIYAKDGWGAGTGWAEHQSALLRRGAQRVSLSIITYKTRDHDYGKKTLYELAKRLLRGLNGNVVVE